MRLFLSGELVILVQVEWMTFSYHQKMFKVISPPYRLSLPWKRQKRRTTLRSSKSMQNSFTRLMWQCPLRSASFEQRVTFSLFLRRMMSSQHYLRRTENSFSTNTTLNIFLHGLVFQNQQQTFQVINKGQSWDGEERRVEGRGNFQGIRDQNLFGSKGYQVMNQGSQMKLFGLGGRYYFRSILRHLLRSFYILIGLNFLGQIRGKQSYLIVFGALISMVRLRHYRPNCSTFAFNDILPFLKGKNDSQLVVRAFQSNECYLLILLIESSEQLLSPKPPVSKDLPLLNSGHISCFNDQNLLRLLWAHISCYFRRALGLPVWQQVSFILLLQPYCFILIWLNLRTIKLQTWHYNKEIIEELLE